MRLLIYSFIISFLFTTNVLADVSLYENNRIILQYAGEIGKYSVGIGKRINKYYSLSVHYGFVPATEIQNKIETYTFKNNLYIYSFGVEKFEIESYVGLALFHVPGNKYKTQELDGTPDDYYRQSSIRGLAYFGVDVSYRKDVSLYFESGINDIWIISSRNNDSIDYKDHVSLGIGGVYRF